MNNKRLVIKGTILVGHQNFKIGEDTFSSLLLSVMYSWYYSTYSSAGEPLISYSEQELREYGRIRSALNGYTNDLHNISINYCLFNEFNNNYELGTPKGDLYLELLIENIFTNIRSLYDFFIILLKFALPKNSLNNIQ